MADGVRYKLEITDTTKGSSAVLEVGSIMDLLDPHPDSANTALIEKWLKDFMDRTN